MTRRHRGLWFATTVAAGVLALGAATTVTAGTRVVGSLTATSHAPGARGRAKLALKSASKGRFRVVARGLAPRSTFDLVVGGVKIGSLATNGSGAGKVKLSTHPKASEGLLGVDPRGETIEVRDDNGDDDLVGDMPDDDGDSASGGFACCVPDDDGTECERKTIDECASEGGITIAGVDSCIPNPCSVTPPGGDEDVVCCFPGSSTGAFVDDDEEAECDDVSTAECAAAGGTVVQGASCEVNPCAPVPPAEVTVCCVPEEDETECEVLTPEHCAAEHGTPNAATSCETHPCGGSTDDDGPDHSGSDD